MKETTRKNIRIAYLKLLEKKDADKITVKDIAREGNVNRNTFYYHYQDVDALVEDIVENQIDCLLAEYPPDVSLRDGVDSALKSIFRDKDTLLKFFTSSNRTIFESHLWQLCDKFVRAFQRENSDEDREWLLKFQKSFMFGLLMDWFNSGMQSSFIDEMHKAFEIMKM